MDLSLPPEAVSDGDVTLFLLGPEHATETYLGWMQDAEVQKYLESRFGTHTMASLEEFVAAQRADPNVLFLGIAYRGQHVGNVKIGPLDRQHRTADLGFLIGERGLHGRGIGTTALRIALQIARGPLGLAKLTAGVYGANTASARAFEKAGFTLEGRKQAQFALGGGPGEAPTGPRTDHLLFGVVFED